MSDAHSGRSASLVTLGRRTSAHVVRLVSNRNRNAAYKLLGFVVPICGEPFCPFGTRPLASDVVQHRRLSPLLVHTVSDSYNATYHLGQALNYWWRHTQDNVSSFRVGSPRKTVLVRSALTWKYTISELNFGCIPLLAESLDLVV
jgi:hypothetical protein